RYRLSFCCRAEAPRQPSEPVLGVEVVVRRRLLGDRFRGWRSLLGSGSFLQAQRNFTAEELQVKSASLDFDVPAELGREREGNVRFEFRFLHLSNADLTISAVNLHETDRAEGSLHDTVAVAGPPRRSPAAVALRTNVV